MPELALGLDVGGTHTDAVAIDRRGRLRAKAKVAASGQLREHLASAVRELLEQPALEAGDVTHVMLGTHRRSELLAKRDLKRVATLRIGSPLTHAVPPLTTWPRELRERVTVGEAVVRGGAEYDGRPASDLDEDAVRRFLESVATRAEGVAITSVFSPVAPDHELAAAELVRQSLGPGVHVSLSHELGSVGLIARENATVLNGALVGAVEGLAEALADALQREGVQAEQFISQNDGTLLDLTHALRFPVLTIGSGPATGMRGAAYLSGVDDAVVVDAGGTRTDVGVLVRGYPRETRLPAEIAGVRVAFPMPDVRTLSLGGGSVVDLGEEPAGVRDESVGSSLSSEALVFGGDTPTLTDAAVAAGLAQIGSHGPADGMLKGLGEALALAQGSIADSVERARGDLTKPPVVAVGGAGMLVPDDLPGASEVIRPADSDVASAIGAATAPVSGYADQICANRPDRRRVALEDARSEALARAVHAGADPEHVAVVLVEEVPLTYLVDPAIRIRVKAAGPAL